MAGRIGTDESGKGDFFGYLTVAGVYVDDATEVFLAGRGVRDSKKLSDKRVMALEEVVKKTCPYDVVRISPEKYNKLYSKTKNLNRLLGWAHARAIENMLRKVDCGMVIADQFGDKKFIEESLMKEGRKVTLVQMPRAEKDAAVAAASILARAEFLRSLKNLSGYAGFTLPKGASNVLDAAKRVYMEHGREFLDKVAKTHFKTMEKLL